MHETKSIHSLEELFLYAYEVLQGAPWVPIQLDGKFLITLSLKGPSWGEGLDIRSAQYILQLQEALDSLLEEYGAYEAGSRANASDKLLVKVHAFVNSQEQRLTMSADILPFLARLVDKLDGTKFVSMAGDLADITGYSACCRARRLQDGTQKEAGPDAV